MSAVEPPGVLQIRVLPIKVHGWCNVWTAVEVRLFHRQFFLCGGVCVEVE